MVTVLVWRGVWRSWIGGPTGSGPLFVFPAGALLALSYASSSLLPEGRAGARITAPFFLAAVVIIVVGLWDPPWFGPRWYRDIRRGRNRVIRTRAAVPDAYASEATVRSRHHPEKPLRRRQATLLDDALGHPPGVPHAGMAPGHLLFYRDELVFCAETADDTARPGPTVRTIPADAIATVRVTATPHANPIRIRMPSAEIHTEDGATWRFECLRAPTVVDDVVTYYGARRLHV